MKLTINNLSKNFKEVKALENISIEFETGKIYTLLGRNGAGKSTLMNLIANRIFPNEGSICIDGEPILNKDLLLSKIYLMSDSDFFGSLKVKKVFELAKIYDPNFDFNFANELVKIFDLNQKISVNKLSTGYSSIFKIILALCSSANFVMFDEPVLGLDATHRDMFYKLLLNRFVEKEGKVCYIISTHLIEEIDSIAEEAVVIKNGHLLMQDSVENLINSIHSVSGSIEEVDKVIKSVKKVFGYEKLGRQATVYVLGEIITDAQVSIEKVDLQRMFIEVTRESK